ncbi:Wall-associated receptor kinase, C-terminal [Dillenia turbinata]|uniref:non-specific serine/threonine protein kinase n=1 Tax=Dillenia turbinata TaxID=194707 RepID=A0AAN8V5J2_9MAGN
MRFHGTQTFLLPLIATLILTHVRNSSCSDYRYSNCSQTFQCGNVPNIGYPFWGLNRPDYCGWPEFELNCSGDAPELTILSQKFRVLNIINSSYTLNLTRADYWGTCCPSDGEFANTTIDTSFFTYTSNTQNLFLYYKCQTLEITVASQIFGLNLQFSCDIDNKNTTGYYVTRNISSTGGGGLAGICETNVNVPVYQENAEVLENNLTTSHLLEALDGGFGLKWDANNSLCEVCVGSGGLCGYNTSTQHFTCYCKDQPYPASCGSTQPNTVSGRRAIRWLRLLLLFNFISKKEQFKGPFYDGLIVHRSC